MSNEPFKPGDVVQLKSGGPTMTVEAVTASEVTCVWFDPDPKAKNKMPCRKPFAPVLLTHCKPGPAIF